MMRHLKSIALLGLILAMSGIAEAITFNLIDGKPYEGRFRFKYENWDMAKSYPPNSQDPCAPVPGTLYDGVSFVNALSHTIPPRELTIPSGQYAGQKEDAWGIFRITEIRTDDGTTRLLWSNAVDTKQELVGFFFGGVDTAVKIEYLPDQKIQTDNFTFLLYQQDKNLFDATLGSGGRIDFDSYTGIGQDASASLVIEAHSTAGVPKIADANAPAGQIADFTTSDPNTGAGYGTSKQFLEITGGAWAPLWEVKDYYFGTSDFRFGTSQVGDLFVESDIVPYDAGLTDWINTSDDPGRGNVVPEPATLSFLILGGMALLKRRR